MTGVFREIVMDHGGKTYTITPSNKMLRRIESGGVSILGTIQRTASGAERGDFPIFDLSAIVCGLLQEAGAPVDEDAVYRDMYQDMTENDAAGILSIYEQINAMITPVDTDPKKADDPPEKPAARAKKKPA